MNEAERSPPISSDQVEVKGTTINSKVKSLKKSLGSLNVFIYIVSTIAGSGIYISPGLVARYTSNMGTSLLLWTIAGIVCIFGALCFCELAMSLRKTGNRYIFIKEAYGNAAGFCTIWSETFIILPTIVVVMSVTISEHVLQLFRETSSDEGQWIVKGTAIACMLATFVINCTSTSSNAKAQTVCVVVQILGMIFFISIGIWKASTGQTQNYKTMFETVGNKSNDFGSVSLAFISALWSYDGWGEAVSLNEELHDLNRSLKLGIITGMPLVIVCFLMLNLAFMSTLTHSEMGRSVTVANTFIEKSIGKRFVVIVPIIVAMTCFGSLNCGIFSGSRSILSASREGHLPKPLSYIHNERCTPIPALLFLLLLSIVWMLALGSEMVNLVTYCSVAVWLTYGAALFGVIVLRIRRPELERPYKVWLIYPIFTSLISCYIVVAPFFKRPIECTICLCVILSAFPVYYVIVKCVPESVTNWKTRVYSWILDRFPLAECVFEINSNVNASDLKDSEC